jgi:hypothetical protein
LYYAFSPTVPTVPTVRVFPPFHDFQKWPHLERFNYDWSLKTERIIARRPRWSRWGESQPPLSAQSPDEDEFEVEFEVDF